MNATKRPIPRRILSLLLALLLCLSCTQQAFSASETAKTVQLMKTEGSVSIANSTGKKLALRDKMRLYSGYQTETEEASYAWFNLDSSKLSKLDAVSKMELRKDGKKLELFLHSGSLFFNVTEPLEEDETLNIRTSTMVVGIRGTCGWVRVIDRWHTQACILEGQVECQVSDPVTGEMKSTVLTGGETASFMVYPQDRQGDKCEILRNQFTRDDIPGYVLVELTADTDLCGKIYEDSGIDLLQWTGNPAERQKQEEREVHEKLTVIREEQKKQEQNISVDPVWSNPTPDKQEETPSKQVGASGSGNKNNNNNTNTTTPPVTPSDPTTILMMTVTDNTADNLLQSGNVSVQANPGLDQAGNTLEVDSGLRVPAGRSLTLQNGVSVHVQDGQTMQVDGSMSVGGDVRNDGTTSVTSPNTLRVQGSLTNTKNLSVSATGRVVVDGTFTQQGSLTLVGGAVVQAKRFDMTVPVADWEVSSAPDSQGYYTLLHTAAPPAPTTYTVTFDANGGAVSPATAATGEDGKLSTLPTPTRDGYIFDGWFTTASDGEKVDVSKVYTADTTIYAHWTEEPAPPAPTTYTVTFDANGGAVSPATAATGEDGKLSTLPTPTRDGYTFDGWFTAAEGGTQITTSTVLTADTTIYAHWTQDSSVSNVDWRYDAATKTLYITGSGPMEDYTYSSLARSDYVTTAPWSEYYSELAEVVIADGIITIGSCAFYGCSSLTGIQIPNSVTKIRSDAFYGCSSLTSVNIPDGVTSIGRYAFDGCSSLTSVNLPDGVTSIGRYAFHGCSSLTSVNIPDGVTSIGDYTFYSCGNLTSIHLPVGLTSIGEDAFHGCSSLTSVNLPDGVTSIGSSAFHGCSSLTSVNLPDGVTSIGNDTFSGCSSLTGIHLPDGVTSIGDGTFYDCSSLTSVNIPDGVTSIGDSAFSYCSSLTSVNIPAGLTSIGDIAFYNCSNLTSIHLPTSVTSIGYGAFWNCSSLTSVNIPDGVTSIGNDAFYNCSGLTSVNIPAGLTSIGEGTFYYCSSLTSIHIPDGLTSIGDSAFSNCSSLTSVNIPDGVTSIGRSTFENCSSLTSIHLPASLTSMGKSAFNGCSSLTSIQIPDGVTSIESGTFSGCSSLTDIHLPDGVTSIESGTFSYCRSLTSVNIPDDVTSIGEYAFSNCSSLTSIHLPAGLTSMGDYTFYHCSNLTSIQIPDGVTSIGERAFSNCSGLTSVNIPDGVTSIGERTFYGCSGLTSIHLPGGLTSIGDSAFTGCSSLTNIQIPDGVTSIGGTAFHSCSNLTSINLPAGVTSIEGRTFYGCSGLTGIQIPDGVTSIGNLAFYGCSSLTGIDIPASVTSIGERAFLYCDGLKSVNLPAGMTSIGNYAFGGCSSLTDVYYGGTEEQWSGITIATGNDWLTSATIHYSSTLSLVSGAAPGYTDVPAGAWYAEAAAYCRDNGLMNGTGDTVFSPDAAMNRAMMVTVLHRLAGTPPASSPASFHDVQDGMWYTEAIAWASGKGIVQGYSAEVFGVNDPVTHQQVALIFQRYSGNPHVETMGADTPQAPATRAEIAVTLMNYARGGQTAGTLSRSSAMDIMCEPCGIAAMPDGSLLVTDTYNKMVWQVSDGKSVVYAGGSTVEDLYGRPLGGYNDAALSGSYFREPWAIAPFLDGWAVSDTSNNVVRLIRTANVQTLNRDAAGSPQVTDIGVAFGHPTGLASDSGGNLYVSDTFNGAVRKITPAGVVSTAASGLSAPTGLCWKDGVLYIAETGGNRILKMDGNTVTTVAGSGEAGRADGPAAKASFSSPQAVAVGDNGTVYVSDTANGAVRQIKDGQVTTLAVRDAANLDSFFPVSPTGLLVQGENLYICDRGSRKLLILRLG